MPEQVSDLQAKIEELSNMLNEAQNKKIATEVHLQNAEQELHSLEEQLFGYTGLNNMDEVNEFIRNNTSMLDALLNEVNSVTSRMSEDYSYSEEDIAQLNDIITKYNIPI